MYNVCHWVCHASWCMLYRIKSGTNVGLHQHSHHCTSHFTPKTTGMELLQSQTHDGAGWDSLPLCSFEYKKNRTMDKISNKDNKRPVLRREQKPDLSSFCVVHTCGHGLLRQNPVLYNNRRDASCNIL